MGSGYSKTAWANGAAPAISAGNLDKLEIASEHALGVDTIAALRALPIPTFATRTWVRGYSGVNDGGGGAFDWDASCVDADDDGIIIQPTGHTGAGRWVREYSGAINVLWYGARRGNVPNSAPAFQAAMDKAHVLGGSVFIPNGVYKCSDPVRLRAGVSVVAESLDQTIIKSQAAEVSFYADEKIGFIDLVNLYITHAGNVNSNVKLVHFKKGISRSYIKMRLYGTPGVTGDGIVSSGEDPSDNTGNNNGYGCTWVLFLKSSAGEVDGIALHLESNDKPDTRQNNHLITESSVFDGWKTGIKITGQGNTIDSAAFNSNCSDAAISLEGNITRANLIKNCYFDLGLTGSNIKLSAKDGKQHMCIVLDSVLRNTNDLVTDASVPPNKATFTVIHKNSIIVSESESDTVRTSPASDQTSRVLVGSHDSIGVFSINGVGGGTLMVSGKDYAEVIKAVSPAGGASLSIGDGANAAFRIVTSNNGSDFQQIFEVNSAGSLSMPRASGAVTLTAGQPSQTISLQSVRATSRVLLTPNKLGAAFQSDHGIGVSNIQDGSFDVVSGDSTNFTAGIHLSYFFIG